MVSASGFHNMLYEEDIPICQTNFEGGSVQNMVLFNEAVLMNLKYAKWFCAVQ